MSAAFRGVQVNDAALRALFEGTDGPVAKELKRLGLRVQREAVKSLHAAGTGRQYGRHRASAPGQPPATDTGRLAASISEQLTRQGDGLVERVGTDVDYARHLELGTRSIAPRPFLRPALRKVLGP